MKKENGLVVESLKKQMSVYKEKLSAYGSRRFNDDYRHMESDRRETASSHRNETVVDNSDRNKNNDRKNTQSYKTINRDTVNKEKSSEYLFIVVFVSNIKTN